VGFSPVHTRLVVALGRFGMFQDVSSEREREREREGSVITAMRRYDDRRTGRHATGIMMGTRRSPLTC
jgi:hypothetical protein